MFAAAAICTVTGFSAPRMRSDVPDAKAGAAVSREIARVARTVFTAAVQGLTVCWPNNGQAIARFHRYAAFAAIDVPLPVDDPSAALRHASTAPRNDDT